MHFPQMRSGDTRKPWEFTIQILSLSERESGPTPLDSRLQLLQMDFSFDDGWSCYL